MASLVSSYAELYSNVNAKLEIAIDATLEILLIQLQNIIDEEVYGWRSTSSNPWEIYRTGQFLDSWQRTKSITVGNLTQGEISQAIEVMQQFFVNNVEVHEDREDLANIIMTGNGYKLSDNVPARDFWSPFKIYIVQNLSDIFYKQCMLVGLPLIKVGYSFK